MTGAWVLCTLAWLPLSPARASDTACASLAAQVRSELPAAGLLVSWPVSDNPALRQVAFTYDNALAVLALVGCGERELAARIGSALLYVQQHDPRWTDGRLRNAYASGPTGAGPARLSGWWNANTGQWQQDDYQTGSDSGNLAFALLALLALSDTGQPQYLPAAEKLAQWLQRQTDAAPDGGFRGGISGEGSGSVQLGWKSTEHNVDLAAAFELLAARGNPARWQAAAAHARGFVTAMWDASAGYFATGTLADGRRNTLCALDAQVLPLLALPGAARTYRLALRTAERRLPGRDGGLRYSDAAGALWSEGTAQARLLYVLLGEPGRARELDTALQHERDGNGYLAAGPGGTGTGLQLGNGQERLYPHERHLAPLAWVALAETGFNPFVLKRSIP